MVNLHKNVGTFTSYSSALRVIFLDYLKEGLQHLLKIDIKKTSVEKIKVWINTLVFSPFLLG